MGDSLLQNESGQVLLLGVDGGGSKTAAVVAGLDAVGNLNILGRGLGGPSNLRLAGKKQSLANLDQAINQALANAGCNASALDVAVLALAGSSQPDVQAQVEQWAKERQLAQRVKVTHDSDPVLAAGTPEGWGIALIVGTGSVATGLNRAGNRVMRGGWGHWFGDRGSGYDLGRRAFTAASDAQDELGPKTRILDLLLEQFEIDDLRQVVGELSAAPDLRRRIAAVAPVVMEAAKQGDAVALQILSKGAKKLASLVTSVAARLEFDNGFPLALAGGVIQGSDEYRNAIRARVGASEPSPGIITVVQEPVMGCLAIGRSLLQKT